MNNTDKILYNDVTDVFKSDAINPPQSINHINPFIDAPVSIPTNKIEPNFVSSKWSSLFQGDITIMGYKIKKTILIIIVIVVILIIGYLIWRKYFKKKLPENKQLSDQSMIQDQADNFSKHMQSDDYTNYDNYNKNDKNEPDQNDDQNDDNDIPRYASKKEMNNQLDQEYLNNIKNYKENN